MNILAAASFHALPALAPAVLFLLAVFALGWILSSWSRGFASRPPALHLANIGEGTHEHPALYTDAAIATRHLLFKVGSDASHIAVAGAGDFPLGNVPDEAAGAEELVELNLLTNCCPRLMIASEAIAADVDVFTAAGGKIQNEPGAAGTFYKVGRTRAAAAGDNSKVEVIPCFPVKLVVVVALTSTDAVVSGEAPAAVTSVQEATVDGNDPATTQALANSLKAKYNTLQTDFVALHEKYAAAITELEKATDDVRAIGAALATPTLVKVL